MTAHDRLRRQLLDSVAARAGAAAATPRHGRRGPHRVRGQRRGLLVAILVLAVGGGVAAAATQLLSTHADREHARRIVSRAVTDTSGLAACQPPHASFVDVPAAQEIAAVFPAPSASLTPALRALTRHYASGAVVTSTVRLVRFAAGERVLAFATQGTDFPIYADRAACQAAQRARLLALHPDDDAERRQARQTLSHDQAPRPGRQTLTILLLPTPHARSAAGTGMRVLPGRPLPTRIVLGGSERYAGIAARRATTVRIATTRAGARHAVRRTIAVHDRLFAFTLPRDTGPVEVRQLAADGSTLVAETVRR